jgi:hypothetical protein
MLKAITDRIAVHAQRCAVSEVQCLSHVHRLTASWAQLTWSQA